MQALRDHELWWRKKAGKNFLRTERQLDHPSRTAIFEIVKRAGAKSVLECACATAIDYPRYKEAGIEYTGLDITPNLAARAREINPGINVVEGSLLQAPMADASFDLVYTKDLLEHLAPGDYPIALSQMWRLSKKGIAVALFLPLIERESEIVEVRRPWPMRLFDKSVYFKNTYGRAEFMAVLEKLGGRIEEVQPNRVFAVWR